MSLSSPPLTPKSARRSSRFIEGESLTFPDLQQSSSSNEFLVNILSQMDEFEKKRKHSNSNSSVESLPSSNPSPTVGSAPIVGNPDLRRSFGFARPSLDDKSKIQYARPSLDDKERLQGEERLSQKLKGRLRAWTIGGKGKENGT